MKQRALLRPAAELVAKSLALEAPSADLRPNPRLFFRMPTSLSWSLPSTTTTPASRCCRRLGAPMSRWDPGGLLGWGTVERLGWDGGLVG